MGKPEAMNDDISPDFQGSTRRERRIIAEILKHEATPKAIEVFARKCSGLDDYHYWFVLGTLWVSYTGRTDLALWRRLFSAKRPNRATSLMKPSELRALCLLPETLTVYRAHRPGEQDWIAYTLSWEVATRFCVERDGDGITEYQLPHESVLALFLRRGELEVLSLDRSAARKAGFHPVEHCPLILPAPLAQ